MALWQPGAFGLSVFCVVIATLCPCVHAFRFLLPAVRPGVLTTAAGLWAPLPQDKLQLGRFFMTSARNKRVTTWAPSRKWGPTASAESADGELIFSTESALNGNVQVRELAQGGEDNQVVRALWFSASPGVWQSAVSMRKIDNSIEPDWSVLPFPSSRAHAFASALVEQPENESANTARAPDAFAKTAMVLGLGGGTLAGWLLSSLPELSQLMCSELDPDVLQIATSYFGLSESDPRLTLKLGDGLEHAAQNKAEGR